MRAKHSVFKKILAVIICISFFFGFAVESIAAAKYSGPGIRNNGKYEGIYIDIYGSPYTSIAGDALSAYKARGCTWFVSGRVYELTGQKCAINGPYTWYNTQGPKHGFTSTQTLPKTHKAVICTEGSDVHVSILEYVYDNGAIIVSDGGCHLAPNNDYCNIGLYSSISDYMSTMGLTKLIGYVDLGVGFTPGPAPEISASFANYNEKQSIGTTTATIAKTISVTGTSISSVSKVGAVLYNSSGTQLASKSETPTPSNGKINAWYTVGSGKELNYAITAGTTYKYRFFATINGKDYYSDYYSFTTGGGVSVSFADYSSKQSVGTTTATVAKTISVSGTSISSVSKVGAVLYNSSNTQLASKSETPTSVNGVINAWYTVGSGKELNYALAAGTTYKYRFFATIGGQNYYSSYFSFTTTPNTTPSVTVSFGNNSKQSIGATNATLAKTISVSGASISSVSKVGIDLYNNGGTRLAGKSETPIPKDGVINAWYDVNSELGYTLSPNTAYKFRFYATIGGQNYYSSYFTFTTSTSSVSVTFSNNSRHSIGTTNATLAKTISVSGAAISSVSKVGIDLYDSAGNRLAGKTETPTPKDGVINAWYDVNSELGYTLSPSTNYRFRFLATISGTTYYSSYFTFTTGGIGATWSAFNDKQSVGTTNAVLARTLSLSGGTSISSVSSVGIELYNSNGSRIGYKTEKPTPKDGVINMWYDCNSELSVTLTPGTYYTYRFVAVISGATCYSPTYSFTTASIKATGVSLNASTLTLDLAKGTTGSLSATVSPSNATNKAVTWTSSNSSVATVSGGVVRPVSAGSAVITCQAADGSGAKATCNVTVKYSAHINSIEPSAATAATGDELSWTVDAASTEGTLSYTYKLYRDGALYQDCGEIASPSISVILSRPGTYYMTVSAKDTSGNTTSAVSSVETVVTQSIDSISLNRSELKMSSEGVGSRVQLQTICTPETGGDIDVTWTSSDESVVTITKYGVIEAVGVGNATVTASVENGPSAQCAVQVTDGMATFVLPAGLTEVEDEAFIGSGAEIIVIPDGLSVIGERAFADNPDLRYVVIPGSVGEIGAGAFEGSDNVLFLTDIDDIAGEW